MEGVVRTRACVSNNDDNDDEQNDLLFPVLAMERTEAIIAFVLTLLLRSIILRFELIEGTTCRCRCRYRYSAGLMCSEVGLVFN